MFGIFNRRKRTLVEKIVDRARGSIAKQRDYHRTEADRLAVIIAGQLAQMRHHKETFQALDEKIASLDGPLHLREPSIKPAFAMLANGEAERIPHFDELTADDFGLGEELADDDAAILADMGDGRAATASDTLAKINSANAERAAEPNEDFGDLPDNEPQQAIISEVKHGEYDVPPPPANHSPLTKPKRQRKPRKPSLVAIQAS